MINKLISRISVVVILLSLLPLCACGKKAPETTTTPLSSPLQEKLPQIAW